MDQQTAEAIGKWKEFRYRPGDLPFATAVKSLLGNDPLIEVHQSKTRKTDWQICVVGSQTPANFVYAGVFAEADPYETGNFVWGDAPADPRLPQSRIARYPGFKAAYSYAIETYHEKEIWELQAILDDHMGSVRGFNTRGVKRRLWQNGTTWHLRYYFHTPMFLTNESRVGQPPAPEGLHEWVVAAHNKSKLYRANPIRPAVCGLEGGRMRKIADCTPDVLEYGDVVNLVFTLAYVEDRDNWGPVPFVSHIIRVQHANRVAYPLTACVDVDTRPSDEGALVIGAVVDTEAAASESATVE
ncbi:hypothetical protein L226DRAFT_569864 [Lentinus tigrinus ALCF2SS1-7]|uniref:Uncharacterized protein n=1 Tax=Lentinus tigrinus ALCF2SS1-6 TaxID=1328759 RepID=A0A5C2SMP1_9APHY|nr:hypothetical protein L227DRAFT_561082 [Lentinus tigrinus ALCF2SS1-6]RPD76627.1 hypothetical protein L226DRAFT_569864 [Lentinus tigrinus ALCF2SS1-7]